MITDVVRALGRCPTCHQFRHELIMCSCGHAVVNHANGQRQRRPARTECQTYGCECKEASYG